MLKEIELIQQAIAEAKILVAASRLAAVDVDELTSRPRWDALKYVKAKKAQHELWANDCVGLGNAAMAQHSTTRAQSFTRLQSILEDRNG